MLKIDELARSGRLPSRESLAEEFKVSVRTIQRDIDYMRDQLRIPIEFDFFKNGYILPKNARPFPNLAITEGELMALTMARSALESYKGIELEPILRQTFDKLCRQFDEELTVSWDGLRSVVSFKGGGFEAKFDPRIFDQLKKAAEEQREVTLHYQGLADASSRSRLLFPLHLLSFENAWYLFAYDAAAQMIKHYALSRMVKVVLGEETFERPPDFDPETYFAGGLGMFGGENPELIVLRFDASASLRLRERSWHPTQELTPLLEGKSELRLCVAINRDLERWIFSWMDQVEVLEPTALRGRMRELYKSALARCLSDDSIRKPTASE